MINYLSGDFDEEDDNIVISTKPEIHAAKIKQEKYGVLYTVIAYLHYCLV